MTPFFITGLPRSRTAWLANLLTYGSSFCWHDAYKFGGVNGIFAALESSLLIPGVKVCGNSDSGLPLFSSRIIEIYPCAKWVIIKRDFEEAVSSFMDAFNQDPYSGIPVPEEFSTRNVFQQMMTGIEEIKASVPKNQIMELDFDKLDGLESCQDLWNFCVPYEQLNVHRWRQLNGLKVTVMGHKVKSEMTPEDWDKFEKDILA